MDMELQVKVDLFASNAEAIRKKFFTQDALVKKQAALLYAAEDKAIDCDAIQAGYELLKQETGFFSTFRGNSAIAMATQLALSVNPGQRMLDTLAAYELLKSVHFHASDFLVSAAWQIAANAAPGGLQLAVDRTRAFYEGMKERHFFLTGQEDTIFSAVLGLSSLDVQAGLTDMETVFEELKPDIWSKNGVQAISQVLVLSSDQTDAVRRVRTLRDAFRARKLRLDHDYTCASLGILALLPFEPGLLVEEVEQVYSCLRERKGFGLFSMDKHVLLLFSAALTSLRHMKDIQRGVLQSSLATSITSILIAEQAAITAAIASASAAAAASAASSGST